MKRLITFTLILLSLVSLAFAAQPGDTVTISLRVTDNPSAYTAKVGFSFDTNALEFVSASGANGWTAPQSATGSFGIANAESTIPIAEIGNITFKVRNTAANGTYQLTAQVLRAVDTNYLNTTMTVAGGSIDVDTAQSGLSSQNTLPLPTPDVGATVADTASSTASTTSITSMDSFDAITTKSSVNVRTQTSAKSKKVTTIKKKGTTVHVIGQTYDAENVLWYEVRLTDGKTGYIRHDFLEPVAASEIVEPATVISTGNVLTASLNQKLATRTGPGNSYDEPGTFFGKNYQSQQVKVISRAQGDGVWWVQVEFTNGKKLYRLYTGLKRVNVNTADVPEERALGYGTILGSGAVAGYYGPGTNYTVAQHSVPAGISVTIFGNENGYLLVDFYDSFLNTQRRAWVSSSSVSAQWY